LSRKLAIRHRQKLLEYAELGFHHKELELDGELIKLEEEVTNDKQSRHGVASRPLPLTSHQQSRYRFILKPNLILERSARAL
jgi:hypothetical protein